MSAAELAERLEKYTNELQGMIRQRFPEAKFGWEPSAVKPNHFYLTVLVNTDDNAVEVLDMVGGRIADIMLEPDGIRIHVMPISLAQIKATSEEWQWKEEEKRRYLAQVMGQPITKEGLAEAARRLEEARLAEESHKVAVQGFVGRRRRGNDTARGGLKRK